jgi:hypothetical protein
MASDRQFILPNFLIPGAAKAGTSTLHFYLSKHPDIFMSPRKEPAFFSYRWHLGVEEYSRAFAGYSGQKMIGEATPSYIHHPESAARIKQYIPDVKLIFALREPVKRAQSHYWHRVKTRHEKRDINAVLLGSKDEYPIECGLYATHIKRFMNYFPKENVYFNVLEEMQRDPTGKLRAIFAFLGVDDNTEIGEIEPINRAQLARSFLIQDSLEGVRGRSRLKSIVPGWLKPTGVKLYRKIRNWNIRDFEPPELTPQQRRHLEELFLPEIKELETLLDRDLSIWYRDYNIVQEKVV